MQLCCLFLGVLLWVSHGTVTRHQILAVHQRALPISYLWHILHGASSLPGCHTTLLFLFMLSPVLPGLGLGLCWEL